MPRISSRITLAAAPTAVFPWLVEPARLARWIGGFVDSEPIGDGTLRVGARSRDIVEERGRRIVMETEVTELDPARLLAVRISSPVADSEDRYELVESNGATQLVYTSEVRLRGPLRIITPLVTPQLRARATRDLDALRRAIDSEERNRRGPVVGSRLTPRSQSRSERASTA